MKKSENFDLTEPIINFEIAKLAKEKGFPQVRMFDIHHHYNEYGNVDGTVLYAKDYIKEKKLRGIKCFMDWYAAPTQSLLAKWLREVHNLQVYCYSNTHNSKCEWRDYVVYINMVALNDARDEEFQSYEEAFEIGLQVALERIVTI